jgi:hypothetical protein
MAELVAYLYAICDTKVHLTTSELDSLIPIDNWKPEQTNL